MTTIACKRKLNTKSIKDKYNTLREVENGKNNVASHCKVRYTKKHFIYLAKKIRIKYSKPRRKEATKNASN